MAKVTITLPVYNGLPYLKDAVESVLNQSHEDFEFLVIDDGSQDGSTEYLTSIRDPRLRLICRENRGLGATLNQLFYESKTEYVVRMDADDVCAPVRLERLMAFLDQNPDVVAAGSDQAFLVGSSTMKAAPRPTGHDAIKSQLLTKRFGILHPTVVVRREAWEKVGGYRVAGAGEDLDFFLRLCDLGRVANVPEVLYYYRLHNSSTSSRRRREVNRGYDYGIACARARQLGTPEPNLEEYFARWESRGPLAEVADLVNDIGQQLYRSALVHRMQGRPLISGACLLCAASLRPRTTAQYLLRI